MGLVGREKVEYFDFLFCFKCFCYRGRFLDLKG